MKSLALDTRKPIPKVARTEATRWLEIGGLYILLIVLGIVFALPFLWMVSTSLKHNAYVYLFPPQWFPQPVMWENYPVAWTTLPFNRFLQNTVLITSAALIGDVISSSLVAYGFARLSFPGRNVLFILVLSTMMLPSQVTMVPQFIAFNFLGWIDSFLPLIVPNYFGNAFYIFLLRQAFLSIPKDLDEAAEIDGCSAFGIYRHIVLPLARPALAAVAIFSFMANWDDFMGPLIYLHSERNFTLALGLRAFMDEYGQFPPNLLMAASVAMIVPMLFVFFIFQKVFIGGISLQANTR